MPQADPTDVLVEFPLPEDAAVDLELTTPSDGRRTWARRARDENLVERGDAEQTAARLESV
jgi:hypothetical protein